ncbi:MAG: type II secretion system F family protein [Nitrospirae bacterium]|nr:type II secretion system F family protein [Nitrospirota bacterium]
MEIFSYRATTGDGVISSGFIEAMDESAALERLKLSGVIPLEVRAQSSDKKKRFFVRSAKSDLPVFTTELSSLLGAGLPLDRSLSILAEIYEKGQMKQVVQSVVRALREGHSFSEALQRHPDVFPRLYINMVRAGEAGGVVNVVLEKLNEFLESSGELKSSIISAMVYPVILLVFGGGSVVFLLAYVLPKFTVIFKEMGTQLPFSTQVLLGISDFLLSYWWVLPAVAAGAWILFKNALRSAEGRHKVDAIKLLLLRDIITKIETARFCRTLGTLLQSGVPLLQAMSNAKDVIGNQVIASAIDAVSKGAREGKGIAEPLTASGVFPQLALSMVKVGEETGQLDVMMMKVASAYEKSLKSAIKRLISFMEPAMILLMGLVIGFIVISMLTAIFNITELPF